MSKKLTPEQKIQIQKLANRLARKVLNGDERASAELNALMRSNAYLHSLVLRMKQRLRKQAHKKRRKGGKAKSGGRLQGSVMTGLAGKTSARTWKYTK
ncbi:hypothetical protein A8C75_21955 [Marinobacterium aestuarii]|uniref:Uncharacterized protein n=1 Tax=Marinobacterium aestuarii TaxID=1821621 RepID=A0A1A9F4V4_9GAMM|nr:hypothetical protein [Marinobacterium aestuarii]ANG64881.1 hypothetical protein A8C75_21955 [Marinobacterium aestuarii]